MKISGHSYLPANWERMITGLVHGLDFGQDTSDVEVQIKPHDNYVIGEIYRGGYGKIGSFLHRKSSEPRYEEARMADYLAEKVNNHPQRLA